MPKNLFFISAVLVFTALASASCSRIERIINPSRAQVDRVFLVDQNGRNLFFRGADPVINGTDFAIDMLTQRMREAAQARGVNFPNQFHLVDISLLGVEQGTIEIERRFFRDNPSRGQFINIPIFGLVPEGLSRYLNGLATLINDFTRLGGDSIAEDRRAISTIRRQLTRTDQSMPIVVYVHCIAGCDRTGEIIAEYRLRFNRNLTLTQAVNMNNNECGRPQALGNFQAVARYCNQVLQGGSRCQLPSNSASE